MSCEQQQMVVFPRSSIAMWDTRRGFQLVLKTNATTLLLLLSLTTDIAGMKHFRLHSLIVAITFLGKIVAIPFKASLDSTWSPHVTYPAMWNLINPAVISNLLGRKHQQLMDQRSLLTVGCTQSCSIKKLCVCGWHNCFRRGFEEAADTNKIRLLFVFRLTIFWCRVDFYGAFFDFLERGDIPGRAGTDRICRNCRNIDIRSNLQSAELLNLLNFFFFYFWRCLYLFT